MTLNRLPYIILLILTPIVMSAQNVVLRNDSIPVLHNGDTLEQAWSTGLNTAHISHMDINLDGLMDLFIFEPNTEFTPYQGDKILPFINQGGTGQIKYKYEPYYRQFFPPIQNFAICRDYNCDGKMDIFYREDQTPSNGTVGLYRNDSDTSLKFTRVAQTINIDTSQLEHPLFWFSDEIIWMFGDLYGFEDIDEDGDIDIISSNTNGTQYQFNKNRSMEKYGVCDSLDFELKNTCWGFFEEDAGTINLNTCDTLNVSNPTFTGKGGSTRNNKSGQHSRNGILPIDLDGDGDKDLLSGDLKRTQLYSFINGANKDSTHMVSYDTVYPRPDYADIQYFAMPFHADVNNDSKNDLIVSTDVDIRQDTGSVWYYENIGTTTTPNFKLITRGFLQEEMIDVGRGSRPVFFDYNGDSLYDLLIGNYGYLQDINKTTFNALYSSGLALYENIGDQYNPVFELVDLDYNDISKLNLDLTNNKPSYAYHPTLGDMDGDGDMDLFLGDYKGNIHYFENDPISGKANFVLKDPEMLSINGDKATPTLFDIDDDGLLDLIIGDQVGVFHYFRNKGGSTLSFEYMDDTFGNVNVNEWWDPSDGLSAPFLYKDSLDNVIMLSGSKRGGIVYYDSVVVNDTVNSNFFEVEKNYQNMWDGITSSIHGADINGDSSLDFVVGNNSGGLGIYTSNDSIYIPDNIEEYINVSDVKLFPNPTSGVLNIQITCNCDANIQYRIFDSMGRLVLEQNDGPVASFDVSNLSKGVYVLQGVNKNRSINITERFIKMQ